MYGKVLLTVTQPPNRKHPIAVERSHSMMLITRSKFGFNTTVIAPATCTEIQTIQFSPKKAHIQFQLSRIKSNQEWMETN